MSTIAAALALTIAFGPPAVTPSALLQGPQPGWDDPVDEATDAPTTEPDEPAPVGETAPEPVPVPTPTVPPPQGPPQRPDVSNGTGLIIGASITGGLAWVAGLTRMAFVSRCARDIENGTLGDGSAAGCVFQAGVANIVLYPVQWTLNYATWGLAPAAGAIRGRHDGIAYAYDGLPERNPGGFIGSGAALLGVGVIGRIVMYPMFYRAIGTCVEDASKCMTHLRLQSFGVQLSSAMIGAGAGLLAYGIAYNSSSKKYGRLLQQHSVRVAPQLGWDYTGMALSGRF